MKSVKIIRSDNAGEKKTLEENCMENFEEIKFEFTSLGTPQKNGVAEQGFATLYSRMLAIMMHMGLHKNFKTGLWIECTETVNKLESIMIKPHEEKCAHEKFYEKIPDYAKYLRTFGLLGVVRSIAKAKATPEYRGKTCMFLSYAQNHTGGTYHMLNLRTKRIVPSRDIIWLNKTYGDYISSKEKTKANYYILQNEDEYYKWAHVKIDPVRNEVNTENVKTEEKVNTKQYPNKV